MWLSIRSGFIQMDTYEALTVVDSSKDWSVMIGNGLAEGVERSEPLFFFLTADKGEILKDIRIATFENFSCVHLSDFTIDPPEGWQEELGVQIVEGSTNRGVVEAAPKSAAPKVLDFFRLDLGDCDPRSLGQFVGGTIESIEVAGRVVAIKVSR